MVQPREGKREGRGVGASACGGGGGCYLQARIKQGLDKHYMLCLCEVQAVAALLDQ